MVLPPAVATRVRRSSVWTVLAATMSGALLVGVPRPALAGERLVVLTDRAEPDALTVRPGDAVRFRNGDDERHRLRVREPEDVDTSDLEPGDEVVVSLELAGTYTFVDERTDDPAYEVVVTVADGSAGRNAAATDGASEVGGAGGGSSTAAGEAPSAVTVSIPDRRFAPSTVTVAAGGTVTWENQDDDHTVTADDGSFDSGVFGAGRRFERRFPDAGSFTYRCLLHPEMTGTVRVAGSGANSSATAAAPPADGREGGSPGRAPSGGGAAGGAATARPARGDLAGGASVEIRDFAFAPGATSVPVGTTVTWTNRGQAAHTVTSRDSGKLDSGLMAAGATYRSTFDAVGTYDYYCEFHPGMAGRVLVGAGGDDAPAVTPPASGMTPDDPSNAAAPQIASAGGRGEVLIEGLRYLPETIEVAVGSTVEWENRDEAPHTVTSVDGGPLESPVLAPGDTYRATFEQPGRFAYECTLHPRMRGEVVVLDRVADGRGSSASSGRDRASEADALATSPGRDGVDIAGVVLAASIVTAFATGRWTASSGDLRLRRSRRR